MKPGWYDAWSLTLFVDDRGRCVVFEPHKTPVIHDTFDTVPVPPYGEKWKPVRITEVSFGN